MVDTELDEQETREPDAVAGTTTAGAASHLPPQPDAQTTDSAAVRIEPWNGPGAGDDIAALHALILQAHPDVVPELIRGESLHELLASVPAARAAYARVVAATPRATAPVPAGASIRTTPAHAEGLSPFAKIRAALS
jgi:hypothetical protein